MKKLLYSAVAILALSACKSTQQNASDDIVVANLDLVNVENDQVKVVVNPGKFSTESTIFYIPKTVPGTYEVNNYGQFAENVKAYDYDGNEMTVTKLNENAWQIGNATELDKITYLVNDSFDIEGEGTVFSPAGTNFSAGENFVLNLHGIVGYFENRTEKPYKLVITHPENLLGSSSLTEVPSQENTSATGKDVFLVDRYFQVTDHPIMYAEPDTVVFELKGMEVILSVYSPTGKYSAKDMEPYIREMVEAQKTFLGDINSTDKYAILLYLSDMEKDAQGFGALEHHTSTTVVLPESMDPQSLKQTMVDVVSHEFFHTLTPLNVHSKEIHYFDYNDPEMSKHLWMYEGVTEYFANLFQVNQGLISNQEFYDRMTGKIQTSRRFDDTMPFTVMSENILDDKYHGSYYNVYQKGALIGMALDIRLRELSKGEMGILDLMKKLSAKYGVDQPFNDDELFNDIVAMTYPEIETFLNTYVSGTTPIPYDEFFAKVGLEKKTGEVSTGYFVDMEKGTPYISVNASGEIFIAGKNSFIEKAGLKSGDIIKSIDGKTYSMKNIRDLIMMAQGWEPGGTAEFVIERGGKEMTLTAETIEPTVEGTTLAEMDLPKTDSRVQLREAWLKG